MRPYVPPADRVLITIGVAIALLTWIFIGISTTINHDYVLVAVIGYVLYFSSVFVVPILALAIAVRCRALWFECLACGYAALTVTGFGWWLRSEGSYDASMIPLAAGVISTVLLGGPGVAPADEFVLGMNACVLTLGFIALATMIRLLSGKSAFPALLRRSDVA